MAFDFNKTLEDMVGAIAGVLSGEWPKVEACVKKALQEEKDAMVQIAEARLLGEINDEEMKSQLEDENFVLEAALLACQVKANVMAQQAANAAIKVLNTAIEAALKAI